MFEVTIGFHYSRGRLRVSSRRGYAFALLTSLGLAMVPACAQYPGQITKKDKETPELRAVGVLEWTGEPGKPKTSRLIPVTVFDGEQLQDGGVYLARPQPLAVEGGVEYILQRDGARIGLFDIEGAGQEQGSWVGFGKWKAMPSPKAAPVAPARIDEDEASDKPTLHRKHGGSSSSGSDSDAPAAPADPDRPTLHKKTSSDDDSSNTSASSAPTSSSAPSSSSAPAPDSSKPNAQNAGSSNESSGTAAADPDRPTLKKGKPAKSQEPEGYVSSVATTDPNRPKIERGKSDGGVGGAEVTPTLTGSPVDMQQAVAVSDPRNKPEHPWKYSWADPADELKMKTSLEEIARTALGLSKPAGATKTRATAAATAKVRHAIPAAEPAPLADEEFRVFELAYGSGATLVLTAHTDDPPEKRKYVTLIAQPDLYGNALVLFKSVTDAAHLDETPTMRLIDAVDAMADNRGELLFELRGETQRQFALYRVMRGSAEKLFVTSGGTYGSQAKN